MDYKLDINSCKTNSQGCCGNGARKLTVFDWFSDLPETKDETDYVEVQFKNTRKGFFNNSTKINLNKGDIVAVESSPGHDIGEVTLVGKLVLFQMRKSSFDPQKNEVKRVYRIARQVDIDKWNEAKAREHVTMIKARQIAEDLKLNMKIGDVEFQGDGNKAIFYYIADDRVDFRQLIKDLADAFRVRIEMKQIGARQEAGRIGGIGPCGRQLCCSTWMTSFNSVSTSAARYQDISLNPQKLAGQCAKLKCCMNYELDAYVDALKDFPSKEVQLESADATFYHFKSDVFKRQMTYSSAPNFPSNLVVLSVERVKQIITMNKAGKKPEQLEEKIEETEKTPPTDFHNVVGQDSLTRFDTKKKQQSNNSQNQNRRPNQRPNDSQTGERKPIAPPIKVNAAASSAPTSPSASTEAPVTAENANRPNNNKFNRKKKFKKPNIDRKNEPNKE
jgi:cell fate regulator YaaT (PSP1 superfamily)